MNVLYVAPDIPVPHTGDYIGGSTHTLEVSKEIAKLGNTVYIVSNRMRGQSSFEKVSEGVYTYRIYRALFFPFKNKLNPNKSKENKIRKFLENTYLNTLYRFSVMIMTTKISKKHKINVILERNSAKGAGVFSGIILGIPSLVELIDPEYSKSALKLSKKIFAYTKEIVPAPLHSKTEIVHAGVDTELFMSAKPANIRSRYTIKGKVVVYVGSMSSWHGAEHLIDVTVKLKDMNITFLLVGKDLEILKEEAKKKGVLEKFIFTGFVPNNEVPAYIAAADVAVAPYDPRNSEKMNQYGFYFSPIKIFEYMACGKPIVASDVNIIREVIRECKCGLLAKPGDAEDIAEKIKLLLENEDIRYEYGKSGRNAVQEKFSWESVVDKINQGIQEVLETQQQ
ncbi:glycosyltransferase family 4 protein [Methanosarcina sp. 1.H.A.2.2]|uniref:glycosyltransferase family 4 protein n=1 Tax=Methanosarcina sp. 1.H.A.2.2 TaxID=1483601 RepID=UPI0006226648|nr:glycosyltransferase family 4 protein [Methanosarcina sp. 1.H.A.2.2]KKH47435.1 hypothetical protein EO93_01285 [Methanosarcina sp. 1.H.A.2.2]